MKSLGGEKSFGGEKSLSVEKSFSGEKSFGGEKSFYFFMYLFRVLEHSKHFIKIFLFASEIPGTLIFFKKGIILSVSRMEHRKIPMH